MKKTDETERHRNREREEPEATDEVPPLATAIRTLQEAVRISLEAGVNERCLFTYARALKAFEVTTRTRLSPQELGNAFTLWWSTAKPQLPAGADFDEWRFDFGDAVSRAKSPLGANHFAEALRRSLADALPHQALKYESSGLRRLVAVCYHLQQMVGEGAFFLSVRQVAEIMKTSNLNRASAMVIGLVRDGILEVVSKGTPGGNRATRYRFAQSHQP